MKVALFIPCFIDAFYPEVGVATLELLEGHFERGWRAFEARWTVRGLEARRHRSIPAWLGDADVRGKRLLTTLLERLWRHREASVLDAFNETIQALVKGVEASW